MDEMERKRRKEAYSERLNRCLALIDTGFIGYPALHELMNTRKYQQMLKALIDTLQRYEDYWQPKPGKGNQETMYIYRASRDIAKDYSYIAKSFDTWSHAINLFGCIGLLGVKHPTAKNASTDGEWRAVEYAKETAQRDEELLFGRRQEGQKAIILYHPTTYIWLDEYTPKRLAAADRLTKQWIAKPYRKQAALEKDHVIQIWGKRLADKIFGDERGITEDQKQVIQKMAFVLEGLLKGKPYTTKQEFQAAYGDGWESAWKRKRKIVFDRMGINPPHQSTREERIKYQIPIEGTFWIITRKNDFSHV